MSEAQPPPFEPVELLGRGRVAQVFGWGDRAVKLFHDRILDDLVEAEWTATREATDLGLPVAAALSRDVFDGRQGIVLRRLDGETLLRRLARSPTRALAHLREAAGLQAAVHGRRTDRVQGQKTLMSRLIHSARVPEPIRRAALARLERLPEGDRLCHGDFHPDNLICAPDGLRVIDWSNASRGDPAGDLATTLFILRFHGRRLSRRLPRAAEAGLRDVLASWYAASYRRHAGADLAAVRAWRLPAFVAAMPRTPSPHDRSALRLLARLAEDEGAGGSA